MYRLHQAIKIFDMPNESPIDELHKQVLLFEEIHQPDQSGDQSGEHRNNLKSSNLGLNSVEGDRSFNFDENGRIDFSNSL